MYNDWSFRDSLPGIKTMFFTRNSEGKHELVPRIKTLVTFAYLNLVEDPYPWVGNNTNAVDIVFCRNVLMYFEAKRSHHLLTRLSSCLVDGGWLFVNPVEAPHIPVPLLTAVHFLGALAYRRIAESTKLEPVPMALSLRYATFDLADERPVEVPQADEGEAGNVAVSTFPGQSHYAEAAARVGATVVQEPDNADAMGLRATTYANRGRLDDAVQWCEKASRADRLNPSWMIAPPRNRSSSSSFRWRAKATRSNRRSCARCIR